MALSSLDPWQLGMDYVKLECLVNKKTQTRSPFNIVEKDVIRN